MGLFRRTKAKEAQQWVETYARLMEEIAIYSSPYISQGSTNPTDETALLKSVTGAPAMATRAIADRVASLEFEVVARTRARDGVVEDQVIDNHPMKLLLDNPSAWHSGRQLKRVVAYHLVTLGEAYLAKIINPGTKIPESLQILRPDQVKPIGDGRILKGYEIVTAQGQRRENLKPDEVCRIWNPDPSAPFAARGTLGPQGRLADMLEYAEDHLRGFYESDATPAVVLEATNPDAPTPTDRGVLQRFDLAWIKAYHKRRGHKRGVPPFLAPGWSAKVLDAAETLSSTRVLMEYARDQILMAYGVPRSVLGDVVDANRAAADTNQYVFDRYTVTPVADAISDGLTRDIASMYPQRQGIKLMVRFQEFVSADQEFILKEEAQDVALKVRTINEIRAKRGIPDVDWGNEPVGTFADTPYRPNEQRTMPMDVPGAFGESKPKPDDDEESEPKPDDEAPRARSARSKAQAEWERYVKREQTYVPRAEARMKRIFDRQEQKVLAQLKRYTEPRARIRPEDLITEAEWYELFQAQFDPIRREAFLASGNESIAAIIEAGFDVSRFIFTEEMQRWLAAEGALLVKNTTRSTQKRIAEALMEVAAEGETLNTAAKRIQEVFNVRRQHAYTIARTEILKATQTAQLEGWKQSGVVDRKQWNTALDGAVRDNHIYAESQIVGVDQPFILGNGEMADKPGVGYQGQPMTAGNAINCRCFMTEVFKGE